MPVHLCLLALAHPRTITHTHLLNLHVQSLCVTPPTSTSFPKNLYSHTPITPPHTHNRRPVDSEALSGRWSLLYQAPTREQDAATRNPDTTLEGPVLARLRPVFGGLVRTKVSWCCVPLADNQLQSNHR